MWRGKDVMITEDFLVGSCSNTATHQAVNEGNVHPILCFRIGHLSLKMTGSRIPKRRDGAWSRWLLYEYSEDIVAMCFGGDDHTVFFRFFPCV